MPRRRAQAARSGTRGLTLLELLVVLAILAIATAGASLSLRQPQQQALQREGERLAALLEGGRAWSRSTGLALTWRAGPAGFEFIGREALPQWQGWLDPQVEVEWPRQAPARQLVLGPEPIIGAQSLVLRLQGQSVTLRTDGLQPFAVSRP